jgi:hypothetical protein
VASDASDKQEKWSRPTKKAGDSGAASQSVAGGDTLEAYEEHRALFHQPSDSSLFPSIYYKNNKDKSAEYAHNYG